MRRSPTVDAAAPGTVADHLHPLPPAGFPVDRLDFVTSLCRDRRVLHLGCADDTAVAEKLASGRHLHARLTECSSVVGLDLDVTRLGMLGGHGFGKLVAADAMMLPFRPSSFDDVVMGEILEHLPNALGVLTALRRSDVARRLIVTVPNGYSAYCAAALRRGVEVVNPDHLCTFTPITLGNLLTRAGWSVSEMRSYAWSLPRSPMTSLRAVVRRLQGDHSSGPVHPRYVVEEALRWRTYRQQPFTGDGLIAVAT